MYRPTYKGPDGAKRTSGIWRWKLGDHLNLSTGCRELKDAERWRVERLAEMGRGGLVGVRAAALKYEDIERSYLEAHALEGRRSHPESELRHLRKHFGGWLARDITPDAARRYATVKRSEGYEVATVNLHLARLRRMLRLAWQSGKLAQAPYVPLLPGAKVRRGFLELGDVESIVVSLPERVRPVVWFLALTGWRLGEAIRLEWSRVDREAQEIRLDTSKSGAPRCVPYSTYPPLADLIEQQWRVRLATGTGKTGDLMPGPRNEAASSSRAQSWLSRGAQPPADAHDSSPVQRTSGGCGACDTHGAGFPDQIAGAESESGATWRATRERLKTGFLPVGAQSTVKPDASRVSPAAALQLSPWVFPSRRQFRRLSKDTVERAWRRAAAEAGHAGALLHDLRRSFVRRCERVGIPRQVAMSLTGHATEAIYTRYAITDRSAQEDGLALLSEDKARTKVQRIG